MGLRQFAFRKLWQLQGRQPLAYFDLSDFDEAALAPTSWRLEHMLTMLKGSRIQLVD